MNTIQSMSNGLTRPLLAALFASANLLSSQSASAQAHLLPSYPDFYTNYLGLSGAGRYAAPTVADIDNDGDNDMLIGPEGGGALLFFRNIGSAASPQFQRDYSVNLHQLGFNNTPTFGDIDGDGDYDILLGNQAGNFHLWQNVGSPGTPSFQEYLPSNPFGLTVPTASGSVVHNRPVFVDLDGDGDLDVMAGNSNGGFYYYQNTGTPTAPSFAAKVWNPFGIALPAGSFMAAAAFADFDYDGDLDMLAGNQGGNMYFLENTGTASNPAFGPAQINPFSLTTNASTNLRPALADMNGDGSPDLYIGNFAGNTIYYPNRTGAQPSGYCASSGNLVGEDWIKRVMLEDGPAALLDNFSGRDGGYGDYRSVAPANLRRGNTYRVVVNPGRTSTGLNRLEGYKVWIDWNRDGDFRDADEMVWARNLTSVPSVRGDFSVPATASLGYTRMRVQMKYGQVPFGSCENFSRGEVEDYLVNITSNALARQADGQREATALLPEADARLSVYPNPAAAASEVRVEAQGLMAAVLYDLQGRAVAQAANGLLRLEGLSAGLYLLEAQLEDGSRATAKLVVE
jgi:hypothetical protein